MIPPFKPLSAPFMLPLFSLFMTSLLASTLLPGGSEAALLLAQTENLGTLPQLWITATAGNTLGGVITFAMGWQATRLRSANELATTARQQRVLQGLTHYGHWALLFSWLPLIGDLLCLAAGWLRMAPLLSALAILTGKAARYALLLWLGERFLG